MADFAGHGMPAGRRWRSEESNEGRPGGTQGAARASPPRRRREAHRRPARSRQADGARAHRGIPRRGILRGIRHVRPASLDGLRHGGAPATPATASSPDGAPSTAAPSIVFAKDFTVFGGSLSEAHAEKIMKVQDMALGTARRSSASTTRAARASRRASRRSAAMPRYSSATSSPPESFRRSR